MAARERPLSPHLQVYRPMYTMVLSISHRITGIALSVAFLAFAWWLVALAIGPESYDRAASALGSPLGLLVIAGCVLAYWYHFCAGIRHPTAHVHVRMRARRACGRCGMIGYAAVRAGGRIVSALEGASR